MRHDDANRETLAALEEWFERRLAGDDPDPQQLALAHGLGPEDFAAHVRQAEWLAGRHETARDTTTTAMPALPFVLGKFRILREAGRGGMGVVYRGVEVPSGRDVAVKVFPAALSGDPRNRERFLREARAAAGLAHPHIVTVIDAGEQGGLVYYAMQWVDGSTLAETVQRWRAADRSPEQEAVRWQRCVALVAKVARALQHAHEQNLLHRDVKPGNILLDTAGEPHLGDFGLVKELSSDTLTATGDVLGSPAYMSPEQLLGRQRPTVRSDVYALGVTLYECLALRRPFAGHTYEELKGAVLAAVVVAPCTLVPALPEDLQWICLRAMAREPATRYPSAAAVAADLEAFARGEPILAGPPSAWLRLRRFVHRHRVLLLGLATLLAIATPSVLWLRTAAERDAGDLLVRERAIDWERLTGDEAGLRRALDDAIAARPDAERFLLERAILWLGLGKPEPARMDLDQARGLRPADAALQALVAQVGAALHLAARQPLTTADEIALRTLEETDGGPPSLRLLRGELLAALGQWERAASLYQTVRADEPRLDRPVSVLLVHCYENLSRYDEALAELDRFTAFRSSPALLYQRVRLNALKRDSAAARRELALLEASHADSAWTAAAQLKVLDREKIALDEAPAIYARAQRALDRDAAWDAVLGALATLYTNSDQHQRALVVWAEFLARRPDDMAGRTLRARSMIESGDVEGGLAALHAAALRADAMPFRSDVQWCHYWLSRYQRASDRDGTDLDRALASIHRAAGVVPGSPWRQVLLVACLAEQTTAVAVEQRPAVIREWLAAEMNLLTLAPYDHLSLGTFLIVATTMIQLLGTDPLAAEVARLRRTKLAERLDSLQGHPLPEQGRVLGRVLANVRDKLAERGDSFATDVQAACRRLGSNGKH